MEQKYELAEKLIIAGANPNVTDNSGVTPLHLAVCYPHIAHLLIEHGSNVDSIDLFDQTPLHCAVEFHCLETVCVLMYHNADTSITNTNNYTPFMMALDKKNVEIQEILFEYVDDYDTTTNDNNLSVLGLALINDSPFTEEIIIRGADVNNVNRHINGAFFLTLHYSRLRSRVNLNTFRLIWDRMDYQPVEKISVLGSLFLLEIKLFHGIIDIFINSNRSAIIAESVSQADDFSSFIVKCIEHHLPLEKFSALFLMMLSHGYTPSENDLTIIFNHWGYCEIFRILLHMDIRRNTTFSSLDKIPTKLIYQVKFSTKRLLDRLVAMIETESYCQDALMAMVVFRILDYCVYPPLMAAYSNMKKTDCVMLKINSLPKVPSLVELARNTTREHIKKTFNVTSSCQLYTLINNLDIASNYKKILTFESVIYRPTFTEVEFKRFIKMLNMTQLRREVMDPVIRSAIKNSIVL